MVAVRIATAAPADEKFSDALQQRVLNLRWTQMRLISVSSEDEAVYGRARQMRP
jgi:hypothetical protein